jgi:hypothetical protein
MTWIKVIKKKPKPFVDVIIKGLKYGEQIVMTGYFHKKEKRFVTSPKGWNVEFTEWQPLPE